MNDFFDENNEDNESIDFLIERFDAMLSEDGHYFFDVEEYEDLVDYYLSAGELEKCDTVLRYAMEQYPGHSGFVIRQAQVLVSDNKAELALQVLAQVEDADPSNADIYLTKGAIYSQLRRYNDAIQEYNKALESEEDHSTIYSSIAYEYENLGDYTNAIKYLKKVLELDPENETIIFELAFCFEITNQSDESIEYFTSFTDKIPYSKFGWFNLGVAYNAIELFEKAIEAFEFAIAIDPTFSSAYFNKANALAGMQHYRHAINAYRETFEYEEPEALTYYYIGECYEKLEEFDTALDNFRKAVTMDENLADAWIGMGVCYEEMGNIKAALRFIRRGLEIDPENSEYLATLALAQQHGGYIAEASVTYAKAIGFNSLDAGIWLDFSNLFAELNDYPQALEIIDSALVSLPEDASLYYRKSALLFILGRTREASELLIKAMSADKDGIDAMFEFAPVLKRHPLILDIVANFDN